MNLLRAFSPRNNMKTLLALLLLASQVHAAPLVGSQDLAPNLAVPSGSVSFSTITTAIALKAPLASPTLTGVVTINAHVITAGTTPSIVSGCGIGPSIVGTDTAGRVTIGTNGGTVCLVDFAAPYASAPICICNNEANRTCEATATTTRLTLQGSTAINDVETYICIGR